MPDLESQVLTTPFLGDIRISMLMKKSSLLAPRLMAQLAWVSFARHQHLVCKIIRAQQRTGLLYLTTHAPCVISTRLEREYLQSYCISRSWALSTLFLKKYLFHWPGTYQACFSISPVSHGIHMIMSPVLRLQLCTDPLRVMQLVIWIYIMLASKGLHHFHPRIYICIYMYV